MNMGPTRYMKQLPQWKKSGGIKAQQIGVYDMASLERCLSIAFSEAFPTYGSTDSQNMIQLLGAAARRANLCSREETSPPR